MFEKEDISHTLNYKREVVCSACNGSKEAPGEKSFECYSCKGTGIKKDPLFKTEKKCNTCQGFGALVKNPCTSCNGTGI